MDSFWFSLVSGILLFNSVPQLAYHLDQLPLTEVLVGLFFELACYLLVGLEILPSHEFLKLAQIVRQRHEELQLVGVVEIVVGLLGRHLQLVGHELPNPLQRVLALLADGIKHCTLLYHQLFLNVQPQHFFEQALLCLLIWIH